MRDLQASALCLPREGAVRGLLASALCLPRDPALLASPAWAACRASLGCILARERALLAQPAARGRAVPVPREWVKHGLLGHLQPRPAREVALIFEKKIQRFSCSLNPLHGGQNHK